MLFSKPVFVALIATILCVAAPQAHATVITFDDLARGLAVPNGYGGLNWSNITTKSSVVYEGGSGYANAIVSPEIVVLNSFGDPGNFSSSTPFTLNSGYFTAAWNDGLSITMTGFLGGNSLYSKTFTVDTSGPTFVTFGWGKVDNVTISTDGGVEHVGYSGGGTQMVMDNLNVSTVPLPAALPLFGLGLTGLAAYRRKKA